MRFFVEFPGGKRIICAKNRYHLENKIKKDRWIRRSYKATRIDNKPLKKFKIEYYYEDWSKEPMEKGNGTKYMIRTHWYEAINDFYDRKDPQLAIPNGVKWSVVEEYK